MLRVAFVLRSTEVIPVVSDMFERPTVLFEKTSIETLSHTYACKLLAQRYVKSVRLP